MNAVIALQDAVVLKGQRAWGKIKATAAEQRQLWREVGEALNYGKRVTNGSTKRFGMWCTAQGFDMKPGVRSDAMWYALTYNDCKSLDADVTHPTAIRQLHRESAGNALLSPEFVAQLDAIKAEAEAEDVQYIERIRPVAKRVADLARMAQSEGQEGETAQRRVKAVADKLGVPVERAVKLAKDLSIKDQPHGEGDAANMQEVVDLMCKAASIIKHSASSSATPVTRAFAIGALIEALNRLGA